jgi:transcriptional regulator with XRE-family HTH domain
MQTPRRPVSFRHGVGLTQPGLASKLGITKKTVAEWEQGRQEPSARRYVQLAKMAEGEQVLWFLDRIGLDRKYLARVCEFISHEGSKR